MYDKYSTQTDKYRCHIALAGSQKFSDIITGDHIMDRR